MPKEYNRSDRVADAMQRSLATLIAKEIRDPRVGLVNINSVDVARDLSLAKVYVTLVGQTDAKVCQASIDALNRAASFLRTHVGNALTMRSVPKIEFYYDESAVRGQQLSNLIDKAIAADKAHQQPDED